MLLIKYREMKIELEQTQEELLRYKVEQDHLPGGNISKEMDSIVHVNDSLTLDLVIERNDAGRHEFTREEILKKYPKVNKEYTFFYEHQTE
jgi:hypothetical protein